MSSALRRSREDRPRRSGHRERERDDLPRVVARVLVIRLDDVAEKEGGAAVGVPELESVVDPPPPLLRQESEQGEQREDDEEGQRLVVGHDRREEGDRASARDRLRRPRP